jgi:uncharacterized protein
MRFYASFTYTINEFIKKDIMAVLLKIKVMPRSRKQRCVLDAQGIMKCYVKSPPEDGKANKELISLLSSLFAIPQNAIEIIRGQMIRNKVVAISTKLSLEELLTCLRGEVQSAIF